MYRAIFLFTAAAMAATSANATTTVYISQAAYLAALGGTITTEDFSSPTLVPGLSFTSKHAQVSGGVFNDFISTTSSMTDFYFSPATKGFAAVFDESPNNFGTGISFYINGTALVTTLTDAGPGTFLGFVSTTAFTSVEFKSPNGDGTESYTLDNLQFGPGPSPVPESATWAMMLTGFAIIGRALRKRGRRARVTYG